MPKLRHDILVICDIFLFGVKAQHLIEGTERS